MVKCEIVIEPKARENARGCSGQGREREREVGVEGSVPSHQFARLASKVLFVLPQFEREIVLSYSIASTDESGPIKVRILRIGVDRDGSNRMSDDIDDVLKFSDLCVWHKEARDRAP